MSRNIAMKRNVMNRSITKQNRMDEHWKLLRLHPFDACRASSRWAADTPVVAPCHSAQPSDRAAKDPRAGR